MPLDVNDIRARLLSGLVIPASPLALTSQRRLDERRQRALCRYYAAAGAGGLAVAVHTTQFAIRDPKVGLFRPVLQLAADELSRSPNMVRIAGICGDTAQAAAEATIARDLGYHAGLLNLAALPNATEDDLLNHCRTISNVVPLFGFYLQPAVGGRELPITFWRRLCEIDNLIAIKIAPFNRYKTIDVVRSVAESGRDDIALYTGNDDNIILDLLTPFRFRVGDQVVERRLVGGLLGQWAVWTRSAVAILERCKVAIRTNTVPADLLALGNDLTDANAALFDAANGFSGCIAGLHEVLRRQGLLCDIRLLDPHENLSANQLDEIDRVYRAYPHLADDAFVAKHVSEWLGQ